MARVWLLFGVLTFGVLAGGQIVYPGQYDMTFGRASPLPDYQALQPATSSESIQNDQQFNVGPTTQFSGARPAEGQLSPVTTRVPLYSSANLTVSQQPMSQVWSNHVNNIISRGITKFTLDLDRAIYRTSGTSVSNRKNVIFSPLSVSVAMSLVLLGSAGKTFDEVAQILGLESGVDISQHSEIVHQMFGQLLGIMNYRVEGSNMPRVNSASGIFVQQGYPIRPEFRAISENAYNSEVINLDFRRKGREARDTINAWVKNRTMDKIDHILNDTPHPLTTVILLSALYFKGEWNQHFLGSMTRRREFSIEPNNTVEVDMMYNGGNFPFYEDKSLGVKILGLPYKGLETSMYVLLPNAEGAAALNNFQNQLTPEIIEHLINNTKNETCIIAFPRMKLSSTLNLNDALHNLGLHSLFDSKAADLSLLSNGFGQAPIQPRVPIMPIPQASFPSIPQTQAVPIPRPFSTSIPQGQTAPVPQPFATPIPQGQAAPIPQPFTTSIPKGRVVPIPQPFATSIPQGQAAPVPQPFVTSIPQGQAAPVPQPFATSIPQGQAAPVPQPFATSIPQASPQVPRQITPTQFPSTKPEEYLIFSRFLENNNTQSVTNGMRRNYFTYDDKRHGISVEQWGSGFNIRRLDRVSREARNERRRNDAKSSHAMYATENEDLEKIASKIDDAKSRRRRQSRPIDQNFLKFMQTQNFPFYDLDNLRNNGNLMNPGLYAEEVLHKVEMDVTEKGTEAAASTAVLLRRDGNQKKLVANRPFIFFIRHDPTKLILFWGTVNLPTPNYAVVR